MTDGAMVPAAKVAGRREQRPRRALIRGHGRRPYAMSLEQRGAEPRPAASFKIPEQGLTVLPGWRLLQAEASGAHQPGLLGQSPGCQPARREVMHLWEEAVQLGCQGGGWGGAGPHLGALRGSQVAQRDLTKGPKLPWVWVRGKVSLHLPFCLCPHLLLTVLDWAPLFHPRPTPLATTFLEQSSWAGGRVVGAGGWQVWQAPGESVGLLGFQSLHDTRPLRRSPWRGGAPHQQTRPPGPRGEAGEQGKAARGRGYGGRWTKAPEATSQTRKLRPETGSMEDSGCGGYLWVAFPSLSLMLIFLVYHMISMSVLHWKRSSHQELLYTEPQLK